MKRKMESFRLSGAGLFFAAAAFLALLSFLGIYSFLRAASPTSQVYTVRAEFLPGYLLTSGDLVAVQVPESAVPAGAVQDPQKAIGMRLRYGMAAGDIIRTPHLVENAHSETPQKIGAMGLEYRAMVLPREVVPDANKLIPGDQLEILGVVDYREDQEETAMLMPLGVGVVLEEQAKRAEDSGVLVAVTAKAAARIALIQQSGTIVALLQGDQAGDSAIEALRLDYLTTEAGLAAPNPSALIEAAPQP